MTTSVRTPLLFAVLLVTALVGIPALRDSGGSAGSVQGVVVDGRGYGVQDAAVFLFSEEHMQLVEETRSDEEGGFAFQLLPPRPRVFVRPPPSKGLVPAWSVTDEERTGRVAFVLQTARPITVSAEDADGNALEHAEVRVYLHRDEASVVALSETDVEGRASLVAPAEADIAVFDPRTRLARWRIAADIPEEGTAFSFRFPRSHVLTGSVSGEAGPLAGIVLVAREEGTQEEGFAGFSVSDAHGLFHLPVTEGATTVLATDPTLKHLPARRIVSPEQEGELRLVLQPGSALVVRTTHSGLPLVSRVWSWSPDAEAWSWGGRTNSMGRATVTVSPRYAIHAEPLDPSYPALEAWDVTFDSGTLNLEAQPGR